MTNKDKNACSVPLLCPCCASSAVRPSSARLVQLREARERSRVALEAMQELVEAKVRACFFLKLTGKTLASALLTPRNFFFPSTKRPQQN